MCTKFICRMACVTPGGFTTYVYSKSVSEAIVKQTRCVSCGIQVILDLGHVTFGSVSDWSEEEEKILEQSVILADTVTMETEDDEGKLS